MHEEITKEFISFLESDKYLKELVKKSLKKAKMINPDKNTNPAQSLRRLYEFLDWSAKCLPWQCLKGVEYPSLYKRIDQCIGYFWFIFDQPLQELENMGYYYPSLQYVQPIASWIKKYSKAWGEFLSSPESWNQEFCQLFLQDENFNLKSGIYEERQWSSFNDFFARKLKSDKVRQIAEADVVSPADSYPKGFYKIDKYGDLINTSVIVKSANFKSIRDLIGADSQYNDKFASGTLTHTFLDINDYHRYHFPVSGTIKEMRKIPAANACGGITEWNQEEHCYQYLYEIGFQMIETRDCVIVETEKFGLVAILPIGMSQICSCNFEKGLKVGMKVKKGDPLGFFLFGGSDIVMIFQECANVIDLTKNSIGKDGHILMGQAYADIK